MLVTVNKKLRYPVDHKNQTSKNFYSKWHHKINMQANVLTTFEPNCEWALTKTAGGVGGGEKGGFRMVIRARQIILALLQSTCA